ncbi:MAG: hypothetical protein EA378_03360 [Phycisphaerales bacterium]|nr:MAG: hypothetical protein EA378_03360 [Phycisphaerales bacterium]
MWSLLGGLAGSAVIGAVLLAGGCGGPKNFTNENDRLRSEAIARESRIGELEAANAELRAKVFEADRRSDAPMPESVREALPRVGKLEILEPLQDVSREGERLGRVRVRVRPVDGRGRFVQMVGAMTVELIAFPPMGWREDASASAGVRGDGFDPDRRLSREAMEEERRLFERPPIGFGASRLGEVTLDASALREAYRQGLGSPAYWVDFEGVFGDLSERDFLVRVRFEDAVTGQVHRVERAWSPGRRAGE